MTFRATVLTLYPEAFPGVLGVSLLGKALAEKRWALDTVDIRTFGDGPHRKVDDAPAGGGAGLVLRADVAAAAIDSVAADRERHVSVAPPEDGFLEGRLNLRHLS